MRLFYRSLIVSGTFVFLLNCSISIFPISNAYAANSDEIIDIVFSELEKRLISDFYSESIEFKGKKQKGNKNKSKKGLPKGLAKKDNLTPGLRKQLKRNGTLPPGLEKRRLPYQLSDHLPPRSDIFERVIVDNDILLIRRGTNLIYDILKDAVNN